MTDLNDTTYCIIAIRKHDGIHEDVSCAENLGDSYRKSYVTREEAEAAIELLEITWDNSWGMGICPSYEIEERAE